MDNEEILKRKIKERLNGMINEMDVEKFLGILSDKSAYTIFIENIINSMMQAERDVYLKSNENEYANGYFKRTMNTKLDKLDLSVPRTRNCSFRPTLLPEKYKRTDDSFFDMIKSLILKGNSKNKIISILKSYNNNFSQELYDEVSNEIKTRFDDFKSKQLSKRMAFVLIDGYVCEMKDENDEKQKVKKTCIYTIMGVDFEGNKRILGFYPIFGQENKSDWLKIFHDLVNRGLTDVLMFISDDFSGISDAIKAIYSKSLIQKCYVHLMRNIKKNLAKKDAGDFNYELKQIKECKEFDEGMKRFSDLCDKYSTAYKSYMSFLKGKQEEYLCFLRFPMDIRKYIYTTNAVENFNSLMERARINNGGYFQSLDSANKTVFLIVENMHNNIWKKNNPIIKFCSYELEQKYSLTFNS